MTTVTVFGDSVAKNSDNCCQGRRQIVAFPNGICCQKLWQVVAGNVAIQIVAVCGQKLSPGDKNGDIDEY